jgi:hypothetical protein
VTARCAVFVRFVATALVAMVLLAVAACGTSADKNRPPPCPRLSVLSDAAELTRFAAGAGQDLVDVDFQVEISDLLAGCQYVEPESGKDKQVIVVAMAPVMVAIRGPANRDREAQFDYFVSVVDSERDVLNKQNFGVTVKFPGNLTRVSLKDDDPPVTVDIPLAADRDATDYQILVGLQLTPDELEYNRRRRNSLR